MQDAGMQDDDEPPVLLRLREEQPMTRNQLRTFWRRFDADLHRREADAYLAREAAIRK